jgi:hypothetical protein
MKFVNEVSVQKANESPKAKGLKQLHLANLKTKTDVLHRRWPNSGGYLNAEAQLNIPFWRQRSGQGSTGS